jgi:hypothetical protein
MAEPIAWLSSSPILELWLALWESVSVSSPPQLQDRGELFQRVEGWRRHLPTA